MDVDCSGFISLKEMIEYLHTVCDDDVDEDQVRQIFKRLDVSGDRTVDFNEFKSVMENVKNAGWRRVARRRNRNGSICTKVTDLRWSIYKYVIGNVWFCISFIS